MIEFGNRNIILCKSRSSDSVVSEIFNFLDLTGVNILLISGNGNSVLSISLRSNFLHLSYRNVLEKLPQNLFRVDHLLIECVNLNDVINYENKIRQVTDIPLTFFVSNPNVSLINQEGFDYVYLVDKKRDNISLRNLGDYKKDLKTYLVQDIKNNWESNIHDLKVSWIRDKKLDELFGDSE